MGFPGGWGIQPREVRAALKQVPRAPAEHLDQVFVIEAESVGDDSRLRRARSSRLGLCSNRDFYAFRVLAELTLIIHRFEIELDCLTDVFNSLFSRVAFADTTGRSSRTSTGSPLDGP